MGAIVPEAGEVGEAIPGEAGGDSADISEQQGCSVAVLLDINTCRTTCIYTQ